MNLKQKKIDSPLASYFSDYFSKSADMTKWTFDQASEYNESLERALRWFVSRVPCPWYSIGKCNRGRRCKHSHRAFDPSDPDSYPELANIHEWKTWASRQRKFKIYVNISYTSDYLVEILTFPRE